MRCLGRGDWRRLRLSAVSWCGGGENSTVTTLSGAGLQGALTGPVIRQAFTEQDNNLEVVVDSGPADVFSLAQANVLYATVTVCEPGNSNNCQLLHYYRL